MLYFGVPSIDNNNYVYHKIMIFLIIFIFQFCVYIISDFSDRRFTIKEIAQRTLLICAYSVIGYSIFNDYLYSKGINTEQCDYKYVCANATFSIVIAILFAKVIELMLSTNYF